MTACHAAATPAPGTFIEYRRGRLQSDGVSELTSIRDRLHDGEHRPVIVIYAHGGLVDACDAYNDVVSLGDVFTGAGAAPIFPIYHTGKLESYFGGVYDGHLALPVEDPRALSVLDRRARTRSEMRMRAANNREHVDSVVTRAEERFRYAAFINGGLYTGGRMWSYMKWVVDQSMHIDSAFPDAAGELERDGAPGGLSLAQVIHDHLAGERLANRTAPRVMLVGHSTGAIFLTKFVRAWQRDYPKDPTTFEVVFMAPAIRYDDFLRLNEPTAGAEAAAFSKPIDRVARLRIFTMQDSVERKATENDITNIVHFATGKPRNPAVGFAFGNVVYRPSLLYAISGILEDHPDTPILGLARFLTTPIVNYPNSTDDVAAVTGVAEMLKRFGDPFVLTPTEGASLGRKSGAKGHLEFPGDPDTQASLAALIRGDGW